MTTHLDCLQTGVAAGQAFPQLPQFMGSLAKSVVVT